MHSVNPLPFALCSLLTYAILYMYSVLLLYTLISYLYSLYYVMIFVLSL